MRQVLCFSLLAVLAAPACAFAQEPPRPGPSAASDAQVAEPSPCLADYAARFLEFMRTDLDARNEHGLTVIDAFLGGGDIATADALARRLDGYRRGLADARIGIALAASRDPRAGEFLEKVRGTTRSLSDWQKTTVQADEAVLTAALGKLEDAHRLLDSLFEDPSCYEAQSRMFRFGDGDYRAQHLERFLKSDKTGPLLRGWALVEVGRAQLARQDLDGARATLQRAAEELGKRGELRTAQLLGTVSELSLKAGDRDGALRWATVCNGFAERLPAQNGWRAQAFSVAARTFVGAGDLEAARKAAQEAAKVATAAESIALPEALLAAADAANALGDDTTAERMVQLLCNSAIKHPHHRAKAMAALQLIGWRAQRGLGVDETVRLGLDALARAIDNDPFAKN